jgi:NADH:ubiquinone oxidoreductase subunit 6 (subunit J)
MSGVTMLVLSVAAVGAAAAASFLKRGAAATAAFAGAVLVIAAQYVLLDAAFPAIAHLVVFGAAAGVLSLLDGGTVRPRVAAPLAVCIVLLLAGGWAALSFPWDIVAFEGRDGLASIPVIGDTLAVSWQLPLVVGAVAVLAAIAVSFSIVRRRSSHGD